MDRITAIACIEWGLKIYQMSLTRQFHGYMCDYCKDVHWFEVWGCRLKTKKSGASLRSFYRINAKCLCDGAATNKKCRLLNPVTAIERPVCAECKQDIEINRIQDIVFVGGRILCRQCGTVAGRFNMEDAIIKNARETLGRKDLIWFMKRLEETKKAAREDAEKPLIKGVFE